jgi:hypothetical protein
MAPISSALGIVKLRIPSFNEATTFEPSTALGSWMVRVNEALLIRLWSRSTGTPEGSSPVFFAGEESDPGNICQY